MIIVVKSISNCVPQWPYMFTFVITQNVYHLKAPYKNVPKSGNFAKKKKSNFNHLKPVLVMTQVDFRSNIILEIFERK